MLRIVRFIAASLLACASAVPLWAHEFWVQPLDGPVAPGGEVVADIRRGENFRGDALVWNPANFERVEVHGPSGARSLEGRLGDRPALRAAAKEAGLHVLVYVSDVKRTTYTAPEQFEAFAALEGFDGAMERHRARVPEPVFSEAYSRYAKALVPVGGTPAVADRTIGLPIEIVLDDMPFGGGAVRARVFLHGQPMVNATVRRFARPLHDETAPALVESARTDAWGRVALRLPARHRILLSAVHLREPDGALAKERNVVWETLWASTVFSTE